MLEEAVKFGNCFLKIYVVTGYINLLEHAKTHLTLKQKGDGTKDEILNFGFQHFDLLLAMQFQILWKAF